MKKGDFPQLCMFIRGYLVQWGLSTNPGNPHFTNQYGDDNDLVQHLRHCSTRSLWIFKVVTPRQPENVGFNRPDGHFIISIGKIFENRVKTSNLQLLYFQTNPDWQRFQVGKIGSGKRLRKLLEQRLPPTLILELYLFVRHRAPQTLIVHYSLVI